MSGYILLTSALFSHMRSSTISYLCCISNHPSFDLQPTELEKVKIYNVHHCGYSLAIGIAPDKAAYCVFTQFHGPENAIKLIYVGTKTQ